MKAVGYIRVSTQGRAKQGVSLEARKAKIEAWALANDYGLADLYEDAGISGTWPDHESLRQAMDSTGKGDALMVYLLSRLTRSTKYMLHLPEQMENRGTDLVSLTERIDTTTAAGKMVFGMLAVLNEFERDKIAEGTKAAFVL